MKNPKQWQYLGEKDPDTAEPLCSLNWCSDSNCHSTANERMCPTLLGLQGRENNIFKNKRFFWHSLQLLLYHYKYSSQTIVMQ